MQKLFIYLKPIKKRIHLRLATVIMLTALTVAFLAAAVVLLYSKFVYMYDVYGTVECVLLAFVAVGLIAAVAMRPSKYKIVCTADSLGYNERFLTAFEALKKDSLTDMERLVVEDAEKCAKSAHFTESYSVLPNKRLLFAPFVALLLVALVCFLPIEPTQRMDELEQMHEQLDAVIDDAQSRLNTSNLTATQQKQIKSELKELKRDLSRVDNKTEAVNSIMNTQTKLKKIVADSENKQLGELGDKLAQNSATQEIGELLQNGNIEQLNEALNKLNDSLNNMNSQQLKELGNALKAAAQSGEINAETKQLLNELGDTLQNELTDEQLAQVSQNLQKLNDTITELAQQNQALREAVEQINQAFADVGDDLSGVSNKSGQSTSTAEGKGDSQAQGSSQGEAKGASSGQAQGQSQGQTQQSGGSGKGTGSIAGANVYTANAQKYADYDAELNQNNAEGTGDYFKTNVNGERGAIVPYTDVFEEYKKDAVSSVEQDSVPYGVQSIVKDYFSSLE